MSPEKHTLLADREAASQLAQEVYDNGATSLSEFDDLDDAVQETFQIPVYSAEGSQVGAVQVKNVGKETLRAMAVDSDTWQNTGDK